MIRPAAFSALVVVLLLFPAPRRAHAAFTRADFSWGRTAAEHTGSFLLGAAGGGLLGWGGVSLLSRAVSLGRLGRVGLIAGGALVGGYLALKGLHYLYNRFARRAADENRVNPAVREGVTPSDGSETRPPPPPPAGGDDEFPVAGGPRLLGIAGGR